MSEQANTPKTGPGELARQLDEPSLEPAEPAAWYRSARLNGQEANRNVSRALDQGPDCESDEDGQTSTVSISSSVLQYRAINGRTYHSARHATDYFTPNDQQHQESLDLTHHYLTILLNGKLFLAPIPNDVKAVVDIGTGTGIWAIDFADMYPDAQVTGTDLSPMQPSWAPCNLKFEIDDATLPWTWAPDSFDFVHMRYLLGAINDWTALFMQAYRCCKPGGWVQSAEVDPTFHSDHGTVDAHPVLAKWNEMFREASRRTGRSFVVASEDVQHKGILAAGFTDLSVVNFKVTFLTVYWGLQELTTRIASSGGLGAGPQAQGCWAIC
ncbi:hypothetical protein OQA88_829 [Cercophora sp. LCS_1]